MKIAGIAILAGIVATAMALLVRAGVSPSLRAALRTTVVVMLGWFLGYLAGPPQSLTDLSLRVWLLLALSIVAIGTAWWLHFSQQPQLHSVVPALADRFNVVVACAFALVLFLGPAASRDSSGGLLLIAGAIILACSRR